MELARSRQRSGTAPEPVFLSRLLRTSADAETSSRGRALLALLSRKDVADPVSAVRKETATVIIAGLLEEGRPISEETLILLLKEIELTVTAMTE